MLVTLTTSPVPPCNRSFSATVDLFADIKQFALATAELQLYPPVAILCEFTELASWASGKHFKTAIDAWLNFSPVKETILIQRFNYT